MAIERASIHFKKIAVSAFFLFFMIVAMASFSAAQIAPRWEAFGGYSYRLFDAPTIGFANRANLNGWNAEGAFNITTEWSIAADVSGHYGSQLTLYNFMIGPQYSWRKDKSKFFGHVLFGKAQNTVNITTATRGGVESVGRSVAAGGRVRPGLDPAIHLANPSGLPQHTHVRELAKRYTRFDRVGVPLQTHRPPSEALTYRGHGVLHQNL